MTKKQVRVLAIVLSLVVVAGAVLFNGWRRPWFDRSLAL